jgi:uncharacterized membrane-anchored protein
MSFRRNLWLAIAGVALVQAAALCWMIWDRVQLLAHGREITLQVVPVDPRSLFRGDYVILNYDISNVESPEQTRRMRRGETIYVTLQKNEEGLWQVARTGTSPPAAGGSGDVVLKGSVRYASAANESTPGKARVTYGIESFFVPEGTGRELEKLVRDNKLSALIAVDEDGNAGIKGLLVDGQRIYEEPLL